MTALLYQYCCCCERASTDMRVSERFMDYLHWNWWWLFDSSSCKSCCWLLEFCCIYYRSDFSTCTNETYTGLEVLKPCPTLTWNSFRDACLQSAERLCFYTFVNVSNIACVVMWWTIINLWRCVWRYKLFSFWTRNRHSRVVLKKNMYINA